MALPKIKINLTKGDLGGSVPTSDGVMGLIVSGQGTLAGIKLGEPKAIYSLDDAIELGIDKNYDTANKVNAYHHIKEYYSKAGTGAKLWIMVVINTTSMADICDKSNDIAKKLIEKANGEIKVLGVTRTPDESYTPEVSKGIDNDVLEAVLNADSLAREFAGVSEEGTGSVTGEYRPFTVIIEGRNYTGEASELQNFRENTNSRVSVFIGSSKNDNSASVGLLLGKLASIPVQRNIGRVKDGDIGLSTAYLSDGTLVEEVSLGELENLHKKGVILFRRYQGKNGYYFNDDATCISLTDDYNSVNRRRVMDKLITLTYSIFIDELLDEITLDDGKIPAGILKGWQSSIENTVNRAMVSNGELSSFEAVIDPSQDVLTSGETKVELRAIPVGHNKIINIDLGLVAPKKIDNK